MELSAAPGALLAKCIKKAGWIAYEDLGAEALRKLYVEDMPLVVIIDSEGNNLLKREKPHIFQAKLKDEFLQKQASESYLVGVLLAIAGGYLDVYTYVCGRRFFANAQTGISCCWASMLQTETGKSLADYTWPILAFMAEFS